MHIGLTPASGTGQTLPQLPQLAGSVEVSTAVVPLHDATQLFPLHIVLPPVGAAGQVAQALPQAFVPAPQAPHIPAEHVPLGHTLPQLP